MGRHPVAVVNLHITYARTMRFDYSRFSLGGLHGKHVVATWKVKTGTIPAFAVGPRKTKKTLCRDGKPVSGCTSLPYTAHVMYWQTTIHFFFRSNGKIFLYLTYWRLVTIIRPSIHKI
jgi:hypothetical protein